MTKLITCYKVVTGHIDGRLLSLFADALPTSWQVEYVVGKPAEAATGKLFAFTQEQSANVAAVDRRDVEIYKALATNPARMCYALAFYDINIHGEFFWHHFTEHGCVPKQLPAFGITYNVIVADTITLIKRLA